jgi:hypothetical protein
MRALLRTSVLCVSLATAACGGRSTGSPAPQSAATVRVENRSSSDVDIYLLPTFNRATRIGFVPAADTAEFALARALLAGSAAFSLEARPVRGGRRYRSEPFAARAGEAITWSVPP